MPVTTSRRALLIGTLLAAPAFAQDAETRLATLSKEKRGQVRRETGKE
jgi:hypothetical protein